MQKKIWDGWVIRLLAIFLLDAVDACEAFHGSQTILCALFYYPMFAHNILKSQL